MRRRIRIWSAAVGDKTTTAELRQSAKVRAALKELVAQTQSSADEPLSLLLGADMQDAARPDADCPSTPQL